MKREKNKRLADSEEPMFLYSSLKVKVQNVRGVPTVILQEIEYLRLRRERAKEKLRRGTAREG